MKIFIITLLTFFSFFNCLQAQNSWDEFLVFRKINHWDSSRCKKEYNPEIEELFGTPEVLVSIKGDFDTLAYLLKYPKIPKAFQVSGKVWIKMIVTKNDSIECLEIYSSMPSEYIESVVTMLDKLEFTAAMNRGHKIDNEFFFPVIFKETESEPNSKSRRYKK